MILCGGECSGQLRLLWFSSTWLCLLITNLLRIKVSKNQKKLWILILTSKRTFETLLPPICTVHLHRLSLTRLSASHQFALKGREYLTCILAKDPWPECDEFIRIFEFSHSFVTNSYSDILSYWFFDTNIFGYSLVSKSYSGRVWRLFEFSCHFDANIYSYNIRIVLFHTNMLRYSFVSICLIQIYLDIRSYQKYECHTLPLTWRVLGVEGPKAPQTPGRVVESINRHLRSQALKTVTKYPVSTKWLK